MNEAFGLKEGDMAIIVAVFQQFEGIDAAILFGSRAINQQKKGSDIDIALVGEVTNLVHKISWTLNEDTPLPYHFDIIDINSITNPALLNEIKLKGQYIYRKPSL